MGAIRLFVMLGTLRLLGVVGGGGGLRVPSQSVMMKFRRLDLDAHPKP